MFVGSKTLHRSLAIWATVALIHVESSKAAFQVINWDLATGVQDLSFPGSADGEFRTVVMNPYQETIQGQIGSNQSISQFSYSWVRDLAQGTFDTSITHTIRSPRIRSISGGEITIVPDEDILVSVNGSMIYAHTPGDDFALLFGFGIRDVTANQWLYQEVRRGGNLFLLPSAGVLDIQRQDILMAGRTYRLDYVLDDNNTSDSLPTGILDAEGFVNVAVQPVPSPSSLSVAILGLPLLLRRTRR